MAVLNDKYKEILAKNQQAEKKYVNGGGAYRFDLQTPRKELKRAQSPIVSYIEPNSNNKYIQSYYNEKIRINNAISFQKMSKREKRQNRKLNGFPTIGYYQPNYQSVELRNNKSIYN